LIKRVSFVLFGEALFRAPNGPPIIKVIVFELRYFIADKSGKFLGGIIHAFLVQSDNMNLF